MDNCKNHVNEIAHSARDHSFNHSTRLFAGLRIETDPRQIKQSWMQAELFCVLYKLDNSSFNANLINSFTEGRRGNRYTYDSYPKEITPDSTIIRIFRTEVNSYRWYHSCNSARQRTTQGLKLTEWSDWKRITLRVATFQRHSFFCTIRSVYEWRIHGRMARGLVGNFPSVKHSCLNTVGFVVGFFFYPYRTHY